MTGKWMRLLAVMAVAGLVLAACSSSGSSKSSSDTKKSSSTTKETTTTTTKVAGPGCPNEKPDKPKPQVASVEPCKGLTDGQTVKVYIAGFTAGKSLLVNECATTTDNNGSGCDLEGLKPLMVGADGTASTDFVVKKGPFGADQVVCAPPTQCLISVGAPSADGERAPDVFLTFG